MTEDGWPAVPVELSDSREQLSARDQAVLALYAARLGAEGTRRAAEATALAARSACDAAAEAAAVATEDRSRDATIAAYLDVSKAVLDRMLKRAELIASAAATVAASYGVVLGVAFSIDEGSPLPTRALLPVIFLGSALMFVGIFVGFVGRGTFTGYPLGRGTGAKASRERLNTFIRWVNSTALARAWALRAAISSLALGIATVPFPFVAAGPHVLSTIVLFGIIIAIFVEVVHPHGDG